MRKGKRTADYHLIKTQGDAILYAAEIPATSWGPVSSEDPKFKLIVTEDSSISQNSQKEGWTKLKSAEFFDLPYLILLTSDLNDALSLSTGYDLMKLALMKGLRVQITESSRIPFEGVKDETIFMLTNVMDEAPPERFQAVRDWCYQHQDCFRVICAAGDPSTIIRHLKLQFDAQLYLDSRAVVEKNFA